MDVHPGSDLPPSGNVIAYNSNSDRGWNDPPTLAFAAAGVSSTVAPRKRIDLRKRVAHNCVSGGAILNNSMQAMNLNENQMKLPPNNYQGHGYSRSASIGATTTYNRPNAPFGTSPHAMHNSVVPSTTPPIIPQGQMQMPVTVPKPQPLQPPAYALPHHSIVHATSMPDLQQPKAENVPPQILNEPSLQKPPIGGNLSYPVFSSSPLKPPSTVGEPSTGPSNQPNSHVGQPLFYFTSNKSHPAVANVVTTATSCLRSMPEIGLLDRAAPTQAKLEECQSTKLNKTMPSLSADVPGTAHHVRSTSMPNFQDIGDAGFQGQGVMPPPVDGYYTRRVSSACSSRQRTPSPAREMNSRTETEELSDESKDTEVLQKTLANLNFTLDKLSSVSDVKLIDDIKKRIDIFTQCWTEGKLSPKVKSNMSCLSIALSDNDLMKADNIHQSLIVDFSNEVRQWMVGIKKIIMLCQQLGSQSIQ